MSSVLIDHVRLLEPSVGIVGHSVLIASGRIVRINPSDARADQRVDGGGRLLTPGLIDLHTHGFGMDLYDDGPEAVRRVLAILPRFGVTCVAPTLYSSLSHEHLTKLTSLARVLEESPRGATVAGFHLEGPFLAIAGAGGLTFEGDVALLADLLTACGKVSAMSISPDTPNIGPVIEHLRDRGIAVFMTHTRADVAQTVDAIGFGARHATHFYDVFYPPAEMDPGVRPVGAVEAILADPRATVDFIADGVHVHPAAIRAALAAKGPAGVALITDSYRGAGLAPGIYEGKGSYSVRIAEGDAVRIHAPGSADHGGLSGSGLTMNRGVSNLRKWLNLPDHAVWQMATRTPASILGLKHKGSLLPGNDADVVLWDDDGDHLNAKMTWVGGRLVYSADEGSCACDTPSCAG